MTKIPSLLEQINEIFGPRILIPISEVAELTGWPLRTIKDECRAGIFPHYGKHGKHSVDREQLLQVLERHREEGTIPAPKVRQDVVDLEEARLFNAGRRRRSA